MNSTHMVVDYAIVGPHEQVSDCPERVSDVFDFAHTLYSTSTYDCTELVDTLRSFILSELTSTI